MSTDAILSSEAVADPYAYFAKLRVDDPVSWSDRYRSWFLTRYDDNAAALKDPRFSSDRISPVILRERRRERPDLDLVETFELLNGWLVFRDPPEHTRMRRLVHKAFSPRMIAAMRQEVVRVTNELLDAAEAEAGPDGEFDLLKAVAYPLPAIVIAGMIGVPPEDRHRFKNWSDDISALVFGGLEDENRHERARNGMGELVGYITELVARVRVEPRDDLATELVRARDVDEALSESEVVATCVNLLFGGHETTTNLIANGVLALLGHPEQAELLVAAEAEQSALLVRTMVEEILRYDGPAKAVARVAAEDVQMRGVTIAAGDRVFLLPSAANRDPEVFENPDDLDITRTDNPHLGFGMGIHYCLGASLARLEASIAIPAILSRFPALQLATDQLSWNPVVLTRGLTRLPVRPHG
jgi:cytochrome P450